MTWPTLHQQNKTYRLKSLKKLSIYNHAVWEEKKGVTFPFLLGLSLLYPGYQRFFSRVVGIFGVGRRPTHLRAVGRSREKNAGHYKDLTEIGNRARKVSGTQGIFAPKSHRNACFASYRGTDYVQQKKQYNQSIKPPGELYCLVPLFLL